MVSHKLQHPQRILGKKLNGVGGGVVAERRGQRFKFECVRAEQAGLDSILATAAVAKQAVVDGGRRSSGSCLDTDATILLR